MIHPFIYTRVKLCEVYTNVLRSYLLRAWYEVADHLDREDVMVLLRVVLNNCVFSFQGKFYKQLHGAAMGSPCSPVVANIYMEYFEKRALGP